MGSLETSALDMIEPLRVTLRGPAFPVWECWHAFVASTYIRRDMLRGFVFAHHVETLERALPRDSDIEIDHPYKAPTIKQTSYLLAIQLVIDRFLMSKPGVGGLRRRIIKDSPEIVDWSRYSKPIKTIASVLSDCYEAIQIMPAIVPLENLEKMNLRTVESTSKIWDSSTHDATLPAVQAFTIPQVDLRQRPRQAPAPQAVTTGL